MTGNGLAEKIESDRAMTEQKKENTRCADAKKVKTALLEVIGAAQPGEIEPVLDALWAMGGLTVHKPPETGMVMMTVRDPFGTDFFLGEVLVTSAQVACNEVVGYGAVMGSASQAALLLAAVEALEGLQQYDALGAVAGLVSRLVRRHVEHKEKAAQMAAATAVRFESMRKERVDFGSIGG